MQEKVEELSRRELWSYAGESCGVMQERVVELGRRELWS